MRHLAILLTLIASPAWAQTPDWARVGEIFAERCIICHSGDGAPLGLQLDSYESARLGGWMGTVLIAGDPDNSRLMGRIRGQIQPQMPLNGPPYLDIAEIALIAAWIEAGLPKGESEAALAPAFRTRPAPGSAVNFTDVEQIFLQRCVKCHSDNSILGAPPEGLLLDSYANILAGGERLAVLPGNPEMSEVWRRVVGHGQPRMPFDGPPWLEDADIQLIFDWIAQGAANSLGETAPIPAGRSVRLRGLMTSPNEIDGAAFQVDGTTRIDEQPPIGAAAELRGTVMSDGSVLATRLRSR